ncbi:MAG: TonB-dependent receptor domain-containing protein [Omnitrophica WOR_2 bacterium]|jgi:outer membrane receptor protein involved in Fe transport
MLNSFNKLSVSITILTLLFPVFFSTAQTNSGQVNPGRANNNSAYGVVSGTIHDETTNEHVEYANIIISSVKDSTMVTGTITDNKGKFVLSSLNPGKYYMTISFIGYKNKLIPNISISPKSADIKLGDISLQPTTSSLQGVEVKSERSLISNNLDKKVITVDKNMALGGGTATDVMENVPSVEVDAEGNISLRGNANITLLVDGKPSSQSGIAASDMLNQIPASAIESIEVITNPSVRYDPDGTSGIINIVLKKKTLQGFNGMASLNVGTGDKYNGSLFLNYRHEKFNAFLNFDKRINNMNRSSESIRTSHIGDLQNVLNQDEDGSMFRNMSHISAGFDYFLDTRNNFTLSVSSRDMSFGSDNNLLTRSLTNDTTDRLFNRANNSKRNINSYEYTLSYKHLFSEKGREFTNDFIYDDNSMNSNSYITQQDYSLDTTNLVLSTDRLWNVSVNKNQMYTLQGNYVYPSISGSRIEAGYKASIHDMEMNYDYKQYYPSDTSWISREELRNKYNYNEQIYAIYGLYANSWNKFRYQAGLRFEQAYTNSTVGLTNTKLNTQYSSFYPSFHTQYDIGKNKELQLSYSRRVRRPSPRDMNPYVDYADSLNLQTGNPELKPEFTNSLELGIQQYWKSNSITASLFYRFTNNEVEEISTLVDPNRPDGVTITKPFNVSKETNYGLEIVGNANPLKWLRTNGNLSFYRALMTEIPEYNIAGSDRFSWSARLNVAIAPWKDASFQLIGNYSSPRRSLQEFDKSRYFADASFKQDLLNKKLSVSLRLTDIFNTRKFDDVVYGNGFTIDTHRSSESRVFYVGVQYQINNFKKKGNRDEGNNEEQDTEEF